MALRAPVRTVPDVERLRRLAMVDRAIATHDEVMRRTMGEARANV
jgi:hypothetical protein